MLQQNRALRLNYAYKDIVNLLGRSSASGDWLIQSVAFDSRTISDGEQVLFFALRGLFRDGHDFVQSAYEKGVRSFVVEEIPENAPEDARFIVTQNSFEALQQLATFHRERFSIPVIGITGSYGKTTVKEWLSELLSIKFQVVRSPKSYNSRLGVALSLLEINEQSEIAIIEAGIGAPGDMAFLKKMVQPTHGILTSIGKAHLENFENEQQLFEEKVSLFRDLDSFIYSETISSAPSNGIRITTEQHADLVNKAPFSDRIQQNNCALAVEMAKQLGISNEILIEKIPLLESLVMRLETFEGVNSNLIINDSYHLDLESLRYALEYQLSNAGDKERTIVIGLNENDDQLKDQILEVIQPFQPIEIVFHSSEQPFMASYTNRCILFKGKRETHLERVAHQFRLQHHQTYLEINLSSIAKNVRKYKEQLDPSTRLLCMVKASSYGSNARKMGTFLEQLGINYLGVAYPDEGVELRNSGVTLPILVMNCEESSFPVCTTHQLEPAIYSLNQLERFIQHLISQSISDYPIHIKLETGMNRLGFASDQLDAMIQKIQAQPEVRIQSIYSHLAESDNPASSFTREQINRFKKDSEKITSNFGHFIIRHILNTEGIGNYPEAQFDMARLGIGMYGISSSKLSSQLEPAISWFSSISQIKHLSPGDSVGYSRTFIAEKATKIAVIPVGYADGFSRSLGQGVGSVFIRNHACKTVGNVCMDMIMVDVSGLDIDENDPVEIIGPNQSIGQLAEKIGTIPYEIMTCFSSRLHRMFVEK